MWWHTWTRHEIGDGVTAASTGRIDLVSETFRRDLHELKVALLNAAAVRELRDHFDAATGELGWV